MTATTTDRAEHGARKAASLRDGRRRLTRAGGMDKAPSGLRAAVRLAANGVLKHGDRKADLELARKTIRELEHAAAEQQVGAIVVGLRAAGAAITPNQASKVIWARAEAAASREIERLELQR